MKSILIFSIISLPYFLSAQQEPSSDLFWTKMALYNPSSIGLNEKTAVNLNYRSQWNEFTSGINTLSFNAAQKVDKLHGAIGINYEFDNVVLANLHAAQINYAFHLPINKNVLSLGISSGIARYESTLFWNNPQLNKVAYGFQLNAGVSYKTDLFTVGASLTQLDQTTFKLDPTTSFKSALFFNGFFDYTFKVQENFEIQPQAKFSTDGEFNLLSLAIKAQTNQKLWYGISYSSVTSLGAFIGYDFFNKYRLGYSYSKYGRISGSAHEFVLSYLLKN